jgi:hypothetical protein
MESPLVVQQAGFPFGLMMFWGDLLQAWTQSTEVGYD